MKYTIFLNFSCQEKPFEKYKLRYVGFKLGSVVS